MERLSEQEYWSRLYERAPLANTVEPRLQWLLRTYADAMLWDHLLPDALGRRPGLTVVELGSAPGTNLIRFHREFNCDVYGVEYTPSGAAYNRELFRVNGLDPKHVVQADILDPAFQDEYERRFDVVFSFGLIEHFDDPLPALAAHARLAKPGGTVIVVIPNLRGVHYGLTVLFNRSLLAIHNLTLMQRDRFLEATRTVTALAHYCGYCGVFNFDLHNTAPQSVKRHLLRLCKLSCLPLQWVLRAICPCGWFESARFSPYLVFIGHLPSE